MLTKRYQTDWAKPDAALDGAAVGARRPDCAISRGRSRARSGAQLCARDASRCVSRRSRGSMLSFTARSSMVCSSANAPCGCPGARMAAPGPALMKTSFSSVCREAVLGRDSAPVRSSPRRCRNPPCRSDQVDRGDGAVFLRADAQSLIGAGPIADGKMLLLAIEHQPHRRAGFLRERRRNHTGVARAELRAEAAAHEFRDHAHLRQRDLEESRQLFAHAGGALRRGLHRQHVRFPVGDHAMGFQARSASAPA